jgi:hypothetical protein
MHFALIKKTFITAAVCVLLCGLSFAQQPSDSVSISPKLAGKLAAQVERKAEKYYSRITNKTEKTLQRLAKFESRIKTLLHKANPEAAARLFDNQPSFASVLEKYREGQAIAAQYGRQYDEYRDKLKGTMGYLASPPAPLRGDYCVPTD